MNFIKSQNILLDGVGRAKVADFGIARKKQHTFLTTKHVNAGTVAYMAPELFQGTLVDEKCDLYSFAVILWECWTGQIPWNEKQIHVQIVMTVGIDKKRLEIPKNTPNGLKALTRECWRHDPRLRPSFYDVSTKIDKLMKRNKVTDDGTDRGSPPALRLAKQPSIPRKDTEKSNLASTSTTREHLSLDTYD